MKQTKDNLEKLINNQQSEIDILNNKLLTQKLLVEGMTSIYSGIFLIDIRTGDSKELFTHSNLPNHVSDAKSSTKIQEDYLNSLFPQFRQAYIDFFNWDTVDERFKENKCQIIEFQDNINGWVRTRMVKAGADKNGKTTHILIASEFINEEKERYEQLLFNSEHDSLTGIFNRYSGKKFFSKLVEEDATGIFLLFDIDHFKKINDTYGHIAGDRLLVAFAQLLSNSFKNACCIRLGGDEFALIQECNYNRGDLSRIIQNFYEQINHLHIKDVENERFSVSIGASLFNDRGELRTFDEVYRLADHRLYNSKRYEGNFLTSSDYVVPDLEHTFQSLLTDRQNYNRSNMALSLIKDEKSWNEFMVHNSAISIEMCQKNQQYLDKVFECFHTENVPEIDYDILFEMVHKYHEALDPFLDEMLLGDILLPHYMQRKSQTMEVKSRLAYLYLMLGNSYYKMYTMTEKQMLMRANTMFRRCLEVSHDLRRESAEGEYQIYAMAKLIDSCNSNDEGAVSPEECMQLYNQFRILIENNRLSHMHDVHLFELFKLSLHYAIYYPLLRVRHLDKLDNLDMSAANERAMLRLYLNSHSYGDIFDINSPIPESEIYSRFLIGIVKGTISAHEFVEGIIKNAKLLKNEDANGPFFALHSFLLSEILYTLRSDEFSELERHTMVRNCWQYTQELFHQRKVGQYNDFLWMFINIFLTDPLIRDYMTAEEKVGFLSQTVSSTMIYTTGHAIAVSRIAHVIAECVIAERPDLLLGLFGYTTIYEIRFNKEHIFNFLQLGCLLHDIGKARMRDVVRNSFRKLTEHEYELLQTHSVIGAQMLEIDPSLAGLKDLILGHHKWYNGSDGYPMSYDNTRSDKRILIDILTLADCLEAATSRMGRGYREPKRFSQVMGEFREGAGTRYNPELVFMIFRSAKAYEQLEHLVETNWENNYQDLFKSFVNDGKSSSVKTNNLY